jgi:hypothetical protein
VRADDDRELMDRICRKRICKAKIREMDAVSFYRDHLHVVRLGTSRTTEGKCWGLYNTTVGINVLKSEIWNFYV